MKRRPMLALLGAGATGVAGCLGPSPGSPSPASRGTPTPDATRRVSMGRTVGVEGVSATVRDPRVRKAVVTRGAHTFVVAAAGQYVVVDVTADGTVPDDHDAVDLRSAVDGAPLADADPIRTVGGSHAFPFPAERHESAAVHRAAGGAEVYWELPRAVLEALATEPRFRVDDLSVPRRDGDLVLELTVANEGDRDGRFRARVSFEGFSGGSVVEFAVPAGETRSYSGRPGGVLLYLDNDGGGTLTVQFPGDDGLERLEHDVKVSGTATGSSG